MLGVLRYQTRPPDETVVLASGIHLARLREDFPDVLFFAERDMEDWGHDKRAKGLRLAQGKYVGFFNDDDLYDRQYIEKMLAAVEEGGHDAAFCNWNEYPNCEFRLCSSTAGNFIVRTDLGREVGYTDRVYEADGLFINALVDAGARVTKVEETLYTHNP